MLKTIIIGASGYTGAELAIMVNRHPFLDLMGLYVSKNSEDINKPIAQLHGQLTQIVDHCLLPLDDIDHIATMADVVFLATAHQVSHDLAPIFLDKGCVVFDLSGAYRINNIDFYQQFYGFTHQYSHWLDKAVYGLAEWNAASIKQAQLIAVPGCYPTASQLAIKPLVQANILDNDYLPVINAISGVSGAGRKASMINSFCEVSIKPYGLFNHRHQPEIAHYCQRQVIFTPCLGDFKRGILATITMKLTTLNMDLEALFSKCYINQPFIRLRSEPINIHDVQQTPFCDIYWQVQGGYVIIISAIDNLLKGASSQAMQCLNIHYNFPETTAIL